MIRRTALLLATLLVATACTPKLAPPTVEVPCRYRFAERFSEDSLRLDEQWWQLFGDTTLNRLIERSLANNRDLWVAATTVERAREELRITRAAYLPEVGAAVTAKGDYASATKITQSYAVTPTLQWEISLFGTLRHTSEAARAAWVAAVWNYRATRLALAAEVATSYFTLLQYERDLMIATRTAALRRESAALIDSLYRYGMSSGIDRQQAYSQVYAAEADIPRYRSAIEQTTLTLNLLLGNTPQGHIPVGEGSELLTDRQPEAAPIGIPSELLQRRPDIMAAYYDLQQAAASAGIARSNRFPSLTLTAQAGVGASSIDRLFKHNPAIWSATGSLVEPIFNFGRLRSAERVAVEQYNASAYTYEQTVLTAFSEVETALTTIASNRLEVDRYRKMVASYDRIAAMAQALYRSGMVDYLDVIDAERTLYTARMELVNLVAQQYINYVSLCKALGGGY